MKVIAALGFLATLALAAPAPRDHLFCFYMTADPMWQGEGQNLCNHLDVCSPKLPDGLAGKVSSAGGDEGIVCWLYSEENCGGDSSVGIFYPGYNDLTDPYINFDNRARSWRCSWPVG